MAKKFNDSSIATITVLNDADMMSTFDASTGELNKILVSDMKASGFGRFGVSGEDDTAAENRLFDADGHSLKIDSSSSVDIVAGDSTFTGATGEMVVYHDSALIYTQSDDTHFSSVTTVTEAVNITSTDGSSTTTLAIGPAVAQISLNNASSKAIALSVNNTVADSAGNIPLVDIADDFINDAAAATGGIAVGGLYHTSGVVKIRLS